MHENQWDARDSEPDCPVHHESRAVQTTQNVTVENVVDAKDWMVSQVRFPEVEQL